MLLLLIFTTSFRFDEDDDLPATTAGAGSRGYNELSPIHDVTDPRRYGKRIVDLASMLTYEAESSLEAQLAGVEAAVDAEVLLATVDRVSGSPKAFATTLFNQWGIGSSERNNGVLVLDGGTITGMKELTKDLYKEYRLWQLYFLKNNPGLIQKCHEKYYESGANIIMTATYNARVKTSFFLNKAVDLAVEAKKKAMKKEPMKDHLIAAAQGCYGSAATASLEYDGSYGSEMSVKYLE